MWFTHIVYLSVIIELRKSINCKIYGSNYNITIRINNVKNHLD